ncbi:MAG: hypothetical protein ABIK95_08020 [Acidobacteriota bacterium]
MKKNRPKQTELKEFVQETLFQIVSGVKQAQDKIKDVGGEICPTGLHFTTIQEPRVIYKPGFGIVQNIEFDIAVNTYKENKMQGSGGIAINVINFGAGAHRKKSKEEINKVKFSVPVLLPSKYYNWNEKIQKENRMGKI